MNIENAVKTALESGRITERHARFLEKLAPSDAALALARLVLPLRMNANTTRDAAAMLDEVSRRDGVELDTLLSAPPFADILASNASAKKRREDFISALRRLRYPEFTKIEDAFSTVAARIRAEGGINVAAPRNFEGDKITFSLAAKSPDELSALLARLRAALDSGDIEKLFALINHTQK